MSEEDVRKFKAFAFLKGWAAAAGSRWFSENSEDTDFMAGYLEGKADLRIAAERAEKIYNIKFEMIRIA